MRDMIDQIRRTGVVPVVTLQDAAMAVPLAEALTAGGLPCAEVTFRTAEGEEGIRRISAACPQMLVGAGTVLTTEQVDRAIDAGAKFLVSPGLNPKVVEHALKKGVPIFPGAITPSEMEQAMSYGLDVVKFFPAEQAGGLAFLKAVSAPYTGLRFMPTGGISMKNLGEYLSNDRIVACGGSWMVKADLIASGHFTEITQLARQAKDLADSLDR